MDSLDWDFVDSGELRRWKARLEGLHRPVGVFLPRVEHHTTERQLPGSSKTLPTAFFFPTAQASTSNSSSISSTEGSTYFIVSSIPAN